MNSKYVLVALVSIGLGRVAYAGVAACATGTLQDYINLGSTGCSIGDDIFASFSIVSPGTAGATPIDPTAVTVTPSGVTSDALLTFSTSQTANAPNLLESIFNYTVTGYFTNDNLSLSGSSETGNGAVTDIQNYCIGVNFGPGGIPDCGGTPGALLGLDGIQNTDMAALGGAAFLGIIDDFTLDSGGTGSASGGIFSDEFSGTAPEPGAFLLTACGLAALWKIRRDRHA